jgi:APA family basic amino acid/polyamine antiporter
VLTYAEVASLFPQQGGGFLFVLHAFGPFAAFFKGWGSFLVGYPASCAGIASILGIYFAELTGWGPGAVKPAALGAAAVVWVLNLKGTRVSALIQTSLTVTKVGVLALVAILALAVGPGSWDRLVAGGTAPWPGPGAFAAALVGILWTYDGWQNLAVISGEIGDPKRGIVRGLLAAITVVIGAYLLLNVAYLVLLPLAELKGTESAASAAAETVLGPAGGRLVAALVVLSAFGALFGIAVAAPRYFYAMGKSGLFFAAAARVDPETAAPRWGATALFLTTSLYVITGTFAQIMGYYVAVTLVYNTLSVASVFPLRRKYPRRESFRVPGFPVVPLVFIAGALWVMGNEIARSPARSTIGILVLLSSAPAYLLWKRTREAERGR